MKKITVGLACVFMYLITIISCELPQSITIKGKPGVHLSLGSPFPKDEDKRLEGMISPAKIKEMMGKSGTGDVKIYDYNDPGADPDEKAVAQAYIVHYPITEMKLDLEDYIKSATISEGTEFFYRIPDEVALLDDTIFTSQFPNGCYFVTNDAGIARPSQTPGSPLFIINLADMSKLITAVNGGPFGLDLDYEENFANNIEMRIPALGINYYISGYEININGQKKLRFVNDTINQFTPGTDLNNGKLEIYVKIKKPVSGIIAPELVFEWTDAVINTENNSLRGEYALNNTLGSFFGSDVAFKEVKGYIYINGGGLLDNKARISLNVQNGYDYENLLGQKTNPVITEQARPVFTDPFAGALEPHSLDNPIDLTSILSEASDSILECLITIPNIPIKKDESSSKVITADMVIVIPLEFIVKTKSSLAGYVKLDMGNAFSQSEGDKDMFGRTKNSDDNLFSQIEKVKITLIKPKNNIINGISILVLTGDNKQILEIIEGKSVEFGKDDLAYPFNPQFEVVLKEENGEGRFKILRPDSEPSVFDFQFMLDAQTDINYTIELH